LQTAILLGASEVWVNSAAQPLQDVEAQFWDLIEAELVQAWSYPEQPVRHLEETIELERSSYEQYAEIVDESLSSLVGSDGGAISHRRVAETVRASDAIWSGCVAHYLDASEVIGSSEATERLSRVNSNLSRRVESISTLLEEVGLSAAVGHLDVDSLLRIRDRYSKSLLHHLDEIDERLPPDASDARRTTELISLYREDVNRSSREAASINAIGSRITEATLAISGLFIQPLGVWLAIQDVASSVRPSSRIRPLHWFVADLQLPGSSDLSGV
jgi:hypothetical protein